MSTVKAPTGLIPAFVIYAVCTGQIHSFPNQQISTTTPTTVYYQSIYGEHCDAIYNCKPKGFLSCIDNICQCSPSDSMIYDPTQEKCYIKAGQHCSHSTNSSNSSQGTLPSKVKQPRCVPHSRCTSDGHCTCYFRYKEANNGTCILKKFLWDDCVTSSQCPKNKGFQCVNGKCICNRNMSLTYNAWEGRCSTMAAYRPFTKNQTTCVQNAYYSLNEKKCKCRPNFQQTSDGMCIVPHGGKCRPRKRFCGRDMLCKNGRCECRFSGQQYLQGRCVSQLRQPCLVETKEILIFEEYESLRNLSFECSDNTECKARQDNKDVFECQCKANYVEAQEKCQLDYGSWCGFSKGSRKCDKSRNLVCINSYCSCPIDLLQYFDSERKICRGLVGAPCEGEEKEEKFCTTGAFCQIADSVRNKDVKENELRGFCQCKEGYALNKERSCSLINRTNSVVSTSTTMLSILSK